MTANTLMMLGASSSVGKSLLVTALCRIYARRGLRVLPYKAQNMSNNAAVCPGGEIGRAQAVQAFACGVEPSVQMNPVLLKPEADSRSQVVVLGKVHSTMPAMDYYQKKAYLWEIVTRSLDELRAQADLILIEGAGSPAELNLRQGDLVNLPIAHYAQSPCLLIGDIDRGGVFAQLLGTLWLLDEADRQRIKGFVVNKFRGDLGLFSDGIHILEERGQLPVLGVVPYLHHHRIADEDAAPIEDSAWLGAADPGRLDIAVLLLPRISNFDDFDPLRFEPGVSLRYVDRLSRLGRPDVIILPGTKSTAADLEWLRQTGLAQAVIEISRQGGSVVGVCGGYQMLGQTILDPDQIEGRRQVTPGLGLLPVDTVFSAEKATYRSQVRVTGEGGFWNGLQGCLLEGYEIHMGRTVPPQPLFHLQIREGLPVDLPDGCTSPDGRIFGAYLHGLFANDTFRQAWLSSLGVTPSPVPFITQRAAAFDSLADQVESALDMRRLDQIIAQP